jgi:hypothetical protein
MSRSLPAALHRWRRPVLVLYVAGVLVLTLAPPPEAAGRLPDWSDKVVHWGLLAGFAILLYWNVTGPWARALVVIGLAAAFAGAIELLQGPLVFRSGDVWDFAWGVVGGIAGFGVARIVIGAGG